MEYLLLDMTKQQIINYVAKMPLDELRWAALMYDGQPTEGKLTDEQQMILRFAFIRACKVTDLWK
jgi:hypothetical protein